MLDHIGVVRDSEGHFGPGELRPSTARFHFRELLVAGHVRAAIDLYRCAACAARAAFARHAGLEGERAFNEQLAGAGGLLGVEREIVGCDGRRVDADCR